MNGPPSDGQQVMIGSRSRSGCSSTISWQAPFETVFGRRVGEALELAERAQLVGDPLRRLQLEHVRELGGDIVEPLDPEREAHAPLAAELVDQQREPRALDVAEEQRGPAGLHRAVGDLGDLEVGVHLGVDLGELALARAGGRSTRAGRCRSPAVSSGSRGPVCALSGVPCRRGARDRPHGEQLGERRMLADQVLHARVPARRRSSRAAGRARRGCGSRTGSSRRPRSSSGPSCARAARARWRAARRSVSKSSRQSTPTWCEASATASPYASAGRLQRGVDAGGGGQWSSRGCRRRGRSRRAGRRRVSPVEAAHRARARARAGSGRSASAISSSPSSATARSASSRERTTRWPLPS